MSGYGTALHRAAFEGSIVLAERLCASGENLEARNGTYMQTPLHVACARGHLDVVRVLLAARSDPVATDKDFFSPVQLANRKGHASVVEEMKLAIAKLSIEDGASFTTAASLQQSSVASIPMLHGCESERGALVSTSSPDFGDASAISVVVRGVGGEVLLGPENYLQSAPVLDLMRRVLEAVEGHGQRRVRLFYELQELGSKSTLSELSAPAGIADLTAMFECRGVMWADGGRCGDLGDDHKHFSGPRVDNMSPAAADSAPPGELPPESQTLNLDKCIEQCLVVARQNKGHMRTSREELVALCAVVRHIFLAQPPLLELDVPLKICGDIHGQVHDLSQIFDLGGYPPDSNYLFLGDYVNRGKNSLEVITLLFSYKAKLPENVFLLRGMAECANITRIYGFYDECKRRYDIRLWKVFCSVFDCLPLCAVIHTRIVCMHGGISPEFRDMDSVRSIARPTGVPDTGLITDLLWAGPEKDIIGWFERDKGVSYDFGPDVVKAFLRKVDAELVCRSDQVVEDGYEFFAERRLVTIFSAPDYLGEFNNAGAFMEVDERMMCSFQVLPSKQK